MPYIRRSEALSIFEKAKRISELPEHQDELKDLNREIDEAYRAAYLFYCKLGQFDQVLIQRIVDLMLKRDHMYTKFFVLAKQA